MQHKIYNGKRAAVNVPLTYKSNSSPHLKRFLVVLNVLKTAKKRALNYKIAMFFKANDHGSEQLVPATISKELCALIYETIFEYIRNSECFHKHIEINHKN